MNITKLNNENEMILQLEGKMDTNTSADLEKVLMEDCREINRLVLDMEKLDYVSSAGLRVILMAVKMMAKQGELSIRNVNEYVYQIFDTTGFLSILSIEE